MPPYAGSVGRSFYRKKARRAAGSYRSGAAASRSRAVTAKRGFYRKVGFYSGPRATGATQELKFFDTVPSDAITTITGEIWPSLNNIAVGTGESQRIGRKITIRKIHMRYNAIFVGHSTATVPSGDVLRLIFYCDTQTNGLPAVVADILDSANYLSHNYLPNRGRFRILKDVSHPMNQTAMAINHASPAAAYVSPTVYRPANFNWSGAIPIEFSGATGATTEIKSNNFGILAITKQALCGYTGHCRVRFTDA